MRDFKRLQTDPPEGVAAAPCDDDIFRWKAVIFGPDDSIWSNATLRLTMVFSEEYPARPPEVQFVSSVFHPNVYSNGKICIDILQNQWTSIYDISSILTSLQSLLTDPNSSSPANADAARLFNEDRTEYNRRVRECVEQSLMEEDDDDDE
jgi:ubiquitin-conjugating enzyme E2 A